MNKISTRLILAVVTVVMCAGVASARQAFKSGLGIDSCDKCHLGSKSAANDSNPLWKKAKEHNAKLKEGKGDFAGKSACLDCHKGKQKPAK